MKLQTLEPHWAESFANRLSEHNVIVVTAKGQPFEQGILLDNWRYGGHLIYGPAAADPEYRWTENSGGDCPPAENEIDFGLGSRRPLVSSETTRTADRAEPSQMRAMRAIPFRRRSFQARSEWAPLAQCFSLISVAQPAACGTNGRSCKIFALAAENRSSPNTTWRRLRGLGNANRSRPREKSLWRYREVLPLAIRGRAGFVRRRRHATVASQSDSGKASEFPISG